MCSQSQPLSAITTSPSKWLKHESNRYTLRSCHVNSGRPYITTQQLRGSNSSCLISPWRSRIVLHVTRHCCSRELCKDCGSLVNIAKKGEPRTTVREEDENEVWTDTLGSLAGRWNFQAQPSLTIWKCCMNRTCPTQTWRGLLFPVGRKCKRTFGFACNKKSFRPGTRSLLEVTVVLRYVYTLCRI